MCKIVPFLLKPVIIFHFYNRIISYSPNKMQKKKKKNLFTEFTDLLGDKRTMTVIC